MVLGFPHYIFSSIHNDILLAFYKVYRNKILCIKECVLAIKEVIILAKEVAS